MQQKKFRWSKVYESSEIELIEFLTAREIATERIKIEEFDAYNYDARTEESTIWCAEGSMILQIEGSRLSLQAGDGLKLPAQTTFEAKAGMSGCVLYVLQV